MWTGLQTQSSAGPALEIRIIIKKIRLMNDFIKQNFFKIIFSFPAILAIVGTVIINLSISKYGIEDFYILSSRNLLVGALFFFLHAAFFYLYFAFIDLTDLSKNSFGWLLVNTIVKPFIFVGCLAMFMLSEPVITIENKLVISMYGLSSVIFLFLGHNWVRDYKKESQGVLRLIFGIPSLICLVVFVMTFLKMQRCYILANNF
jgi:hypothetical protein